MRKISEPQICVVNNSKIAYKLQNNFNVAMGDLGVRKEIQYGSYKLPILLNLEYKMVSNLHEYHVIVIDLEEKGMHKKIYSNEEMVHSPYMFCVEYPEPMFMPQPLVMEAIRSNMNKNPQKTLRIIFADKDYICNCKLVEFKDRGKYFEKENVNTNVYSAISTVIRLKEGKKVNGVKHALSEKILKYVEGYSIVFNFPQIWDSTKNKVVDDPGYVPLILNDDGEVVSYLGYDRKYGYELLLPKCKEKELLIEELCLNVLPEFLPTIFPESNEFSWINNIEFEPKEVIEIEDRKQEYLKEHQKKIDEFEKEKEEERDKYKFLKDLLTESGDNLVFALKKYFEWLGYQNITLPDGSEEIFREDMQIIEGEDMFIIEIKGIGGTSTDAECAQIIKHRRTREKENRDKNIFPIYIVNHQRFINPYQRKNPPFNENQIDYAKNDERGLLSTWQLYQQYRLVEEGVFTKEETKNALKKWGLITLNPSDLCNIGKVKEYYKKPKASIFNLDGTKISVGDCIWAQKGYFWKKGIIQSLKLNDNSVQSAETGEVGMVLDIELGEGYELFIK